MNLTTRERLIRAAHRLFADGGYRGASVRDICNLAGANPGAISYHFGGKRQLYRAVLRRAASDLSALASNHELEQDEPEPISVRKNLDTLFVRFNENQTATRLLLRDLADGGAVAVESMTPPLRDALRTLTMSLGHGDSPGAANQAKRLFLDLAAPLFLLSAGWPIVAQVLELGPDRHHSIFEEMVDRALASHDVAKS